MAGTARPPSQMPPAPLRRLTSAADIRGVFGARRAAGRDHVVVHARAREDDAPARVAVVAGRRVGGAVVRNRAKRRLRACLPTASAPAGVDLVVTAKQGADAIPFSALCDEVAAAVRGASRRAGAG